MINEEKLIELGVDINKGLTYFGNDREIYAKYLTKMLDTQYCSNIQEKLSVNDVEGAFSIMHKMKSLVGYVCVPDLITIVNEMTEILREGRTSGVLEGVKYVDIKLKAIKAALNI